MNEVICSLETGSSPWLGIGIESVVALIANEDFPAFEGLVWPGGEVEGWEQGYAKTQHEDFVLNMVECEPYSHKVAELVQVPLCQDEDYGLVNSG